MKASVKWLALFVTLQGMLFFCEGRIDTGRKNP